MVARLQDADYQRLVEFRTGLRRFLRWSEEQAELAGLTPAQHQLLLAIRGHDDPRGPTTGDVAERLLRRHHTTVSLIDRAADAGLLVRRGDPDDGRVVRLALTPLGTRRIEQLSELHLRELARLGPQLRRLWDGLEPDEESLAAQDRR
jgi:DNA-binding MarR family transcriptional regulator